MNPGRRRALALGGTLVLLVAMALLAGPRGPVDPSADPRMSSYLATDAGTRALYLVLEELELPVRRSRDPWPADAPPGVLVVLAPTRGPDPEAAAAMLEWVADGGTLFHAVGPEGGALTEAMAEALGPGMRTRPPTPGRTGARRMTGDVLRVPDVRRVFVDAGDAQVILASESGEPVVVLAALGRGRVLAWSDASLLGNARLRASPAAATPAVRALADASGSVPGDTIVFDEFHHGFRGDGSPARALADFLLGSGPGRWLLQGLLAVGALLLLGGHRFGAPVTRASERGRSPLEHMEALAAVYRKAGARRTVRERLLAGFGHRLGQRIAPAETLVLPDHLRTHPAAARLEEAWRGDDDRSLVALDAAMDDLLMEVRTGRSSPPPSIPSRPSIPETRR
ncbi:MAG: DUF4350 domain-containing protein [Gemmatimonadales bacterium]|nr:MAG: DUF4350 domain-containing protein [Gemmatimonadales bacterium]